MFTWDSVASVSCMRSIISSRINYCLLVALRDTLAVLPFNIELLCTILLIFEHCTPQNKVRRRLKLYSVDIKLRNGGLLLQRRNNGRVRILMQMRWTLYATKKNIDELCVRHYSILTSYIYVCTMHMI